MYQNTNVLGKFAGKDINLDDPFSKNWPSKSDRAKIVAEDPVAAANFFHTLISVWMETILGMNPHPPHEIGVLGRVKAFYGCIEAQGRGTLHMH